MRPDPVLIPSASSAPSLSSGEASLPDSCTVPEDFSILTALPVLSEGREVSFPDPVPGTPELTGSAVCSLPEAAGPAFLSAPGISIVSLDFGNTFFSTLSSSVITMGFARKASNPSRRNISLAVLTALAVRATTGTSLFSLPYTARMRFIASTPSMPGII